MTEGQDPLRADEPTDPSLLVRFTGDEPVENALLADVRSDLDHARQRLAFTERLIDRREQLEAWLTADPSHPRMLLTNPRSALREALPDLEPPEISESGRELVDQLLRRYRGSVEGVVVYTPPEVFALTLLRDVANDAAGRVNGYEELFGDISAVVSRVEAGRFGTDVIHRVVAGISRAQGLPVPLTAPNRNLAWSALAAFLDQHPEI